jgi:hypothetical protein
LARDVNPKPAFQACLSYDFFAVLPLEQEHERQKEANTEPEYHLRGVDVSIEQHFCNLYQSIESQERMAYESSPYLRGTEERLSGVHRGLM